MGYATENSRPRASAIAAVALLHAGLGAALLFGLAGKAVQQYVPPIFETWDVPQPAAPPPPPAPPKRTAEQAPPTPKNPLAPLPPMQLPNADGPVITTTTDIIVIDTGPKVAPPAPELARTIETAPPRVRGNRAAWITSDDYPAAAQRNEEAGTVDIRAAIDARGRVIGCEVVKSSGSAALDAATCKLYQRNGGFDPARDAEGKPIGATYTDRVRWELPR